MLPAAYRMRTAADFTLAVRSGRRVRCGDLVLHQAVLDAASAIPEAPLIGFIVGRSVGNSVVRHRVVRRLRAQMRARLDMVPVRSHTVVRALPGAADADSAGLAADLDSALRRLTVATTATTRSPS